MSGDHHRPVAGSASAIAHPNIALAKYWGKLPGERNIPAVPSLSVTLAGLATRTSVTFDPALTADALELNGSPADEGARGRASVLLDRVRARAGRTGFARVSSRNDFPTASGLASSASGFAALAFAALRAAGVDADSAEVADLARRSSASAARSVFSGFGELDGGAGFTGASRQVAPPDAIDLRVLVCVTTEAAKSVGSTGGMNLTAERSPYYPAWLTEAPRLYAEIRRALLAGDFAALGEMSERSALAMHALAMAAGIVYVRGATLEALGAVHELRKRGTAAFATMDAGPHLKVLVQSADAALVATWMSAVPGVLRVIEARPGEGVRANEDDAASSGAGR